MRSSSRAARSCGRRRASRVRRRLLSSAIVAATLCAACGARPVDPLTPPPVVHDRQPRIRALQRDLAALFADPALARGTVSAVVQSVDRGDTLFRYNGERLLIPASTLKIVTVAVAAERLGWDHRFTTTVSAAGPIEHGVLDGDLVVTGGGDPTISRRYGGADAVLAGWARQLAAAGLRRIEGRIVADARAFGGEPWGAGWSWEDLRYAYGAPVGALHLDEATQPLVIVPGLAPGDRASVSLVGTAAMAVEADVLTTGHDEAASIEFRRAPGLPALQVTGQIPVNAQPLTLYPAVASPASRFVTAFARALDAHGILVADGTANRDTLEAPPVTRSPPLLVHHSPPLSDVAGVTLKDSHNLHAESLLRAIALAEGATATPEAGLAIVSRVLREWGVPEGAVSIADGSGLSRRNLVAADALLVVLQRMAADARHRMHWMHALPAGGSKGTLSRRFQSGPSQGRVKAKTGSLAYVRAIAGYVRTADEETLAFAIILNNTSAAAGSLEEILDRAVDRLAQLRR
jgi:D-alanyl-D-alanine carboxypeptidase/D-alanyl-D-alanine-endopeptidase (penicillin-binding protein 4)